jgi:hypothetical protein
MEHIHTLYLDLDGVLADFDRAAQDFLGASISDRRQAAAAGRWPSDLWEQLKTVPNFYRNLPKTEFADQLYELALRFETELGWRVAILTAIPRGNDVPDAFQDKLEWVYEHYPKLRVYFGPFSHDKHRHARPGDILVDDRASNCAEWDQAGGTAVRVHTADPEPALSKLTTILNDKLSFKRLRTM